METAEVPQNLGDVVQRWHSNFLGSQSIGTGKNAFCKCGKKALVIGNKWKG